MQPPKPHDFNTPESLLKALENYIHDASAALTNDNMPELAGLDAVVDALCARVIALPADDGSRLREPLRDLYKQLDRLQLQMVDAKASAESELKALQARERASKAYRKDGR